MGDLDFSLPRTDFPSRSTHYERTPRFRRLKLQCCGLRWLTPVSKRADLKNGTLPWGKRHVGTNHFPQGDNSDES